MVRSYSWEWRIEALKISEEMTPWLVDDLDLITRQQATILSSFQEECGFHFGGYVCFKKSWGDTDNKKLLYWDYVNWNSAGLYTSRWGESCFITDLYSWIPQLPDKKFCNFVQCQWLGSDSSWVPPESGVRGVLSLSLLFESLISLVLSPLVQSMMCFEDRKYMTELVFVFYLILNRK